MSAGSIRLSLGVVLASLACLVKIKGYDTSAARARLLPLGYQADLIATTAHFRPGPHSYAGYSGPWLENVFFEAWQRQPDGSSNSRLYLPIAWTDCLIKGNLREEMQAFLTNLNRAFSYFTVLQADMGFEHPGLRLSVPENLDLIMYSAGGDRQISNSHTNVIPVPLLKEELEPVGIRKNIAVSSQGSGTHPLRQKIGEMYSKDFLFLSPSTDWKTILESSTFAVSPRGFGATSFRMYEALQLGTIPIYIWEEQKWLPFQEIVDWNSFAIVVEGSEISTLKEKIESANASAMQANLSRHKHMFTYDYTVQYILHHVSHLHKSRERLSTFGPPSVHKYIAV